MGNSDSEHNGFSRFVSSFDRFGKTVQFTFKKKYKHNTLIGGCCSVLFYLVFLACATSIFLDFFDVSKFHKGLSIEPAENDAELDLYELNYRFAVEKLEPRIGTIEVFAVDWPGG